MAIDVLKTWDEAKKALDVAFEQLCANAVDSMINFQNRAEAAEARAAQLESKLHELEIPCNKCHGSGFVYDTVCDCSGGSIGYATPEIIAQLEAERDELRATLSAARSESSQRLSMLYDVRGFLYSLGYTGESIEKYLQAMDDVAYAENEIEESA